jgi:hypothetical protein
MGSKNGFEVFSNPLRIETLKELSKTPLRFADMKRKLKIESNDLLDLHLKNLDELITKNKQGLFTLNEKGFAVLQAIEVVNRYNWQKRSFYVNLLAFFLINAYLILTSATNTIYYWTIILPVYIAWIIFYSYLTFIKIRVSIKKFNNEE